MGALSKTSAISTLMVLTIFIIVLVRAPVYHDAMAAMTPDKMRGIELSLDSDRALFVCKYARESKFQSVFTVLPVHKRWETTNTLRMTDDDVRRLYIAVSANGRCKERRVDTTTVQHMISSEDPVGTQIYMYISPASYCLSHLRRSQLF